MSRSEEETKRKAQMQMSTKQCCGQPMVVEAITPILYLGKAITQAMVCTKCRQGFHVMTVHESESGEGMVGNA